MSVGASNIARMFDTVDDAGVVAMIEQQWRAEAVAGSRRLAAIAELVNRRVVDDADDERQHWSCDPWDAAAAEVAAAMGISHRAASREMRIALALAHRLPKVAALYARGRLSSRLVSMITWRTDLVEDTAALTMVDAELAQRAGAWGPLSVDGLEHTIDVLVERHDPEAVRRTRSAARGRDVCLGKDDDTSGTTSLWGRLFATDAVALHKRLAELAGGVCADDPRTMGQRRADALGVLAAGGDRLVCQCGDAECPAAGEDMRAANTVVYVIAEEAALDAKSDPGVSGQDDVAPAEPVAPTEPSEPAKPASAVIVGGGVVPGPLLAQLIASGAEVRGLKQPNPEPESRYRPSAGLAAFVRMRDVTCRFPGCGRPAEYCDVDHTVPYPTGTTHPSNTKCLCRIHHLLKTFWGWRDSQLPDGTVVWTTPAGCTYDTKPGSRLLFPKWNTTTVGLPQLSTAPVSTNRGVMMPRRKRTRVKDRAYRIARERLHNAAPDTPAVRAQHLLAQRIARDDKPPPF